MYEFRWNSWNIEHIAEHGVTPDEAEYVVRHARPPFPREVGNGKVLARGQTFTGTYLQVIFILDPEETIYVIHARPMKDIEKRQFRRSRR